MKLFYRGVSYDYDPQASNERISWGADRANNARPSYNLSYRGLTYTVNPDVAPSEIAPRPIANLIYRGLAYALNGGTKTDVTTATHANTLSGARFPRKASASSELAATHRNNLYRNLQHRLQVAQAQGDQNLIQLLERELQQIA